MTKNKKIITAVIAIVVAVALFVGGYFIAGVIFPEKTDTDAVRETTEKSPETTSQQETTSPAEEDKDEEDEPEYVYILENEKFGSGEIKVEKAEYEYYCVSIYNTLLSQSFQCDYYYGEGSGVLYTGFDWKKLPAEQKCELEYEGETFDNYEDYITYMAKWQLATTKACVEYAKLNSITLDEEEIKKVESFIAENKDSCAADGVTLEEYLQKFYSKSMTEDIYIRIVEEQFLLNKVDEVKSGLLKGYYTDDMLEDEYNKNVNSYGKVTLRNYIITAATDSSGEVYEASMEAARAEADVFAGLVSDEESFKKQASEKERKKGNKDYGDLLTEDSYTLLKSVGYEDLKDETGDDKLSGWAFDSSRKAGEIYIAKIEGVGYGVYMMVDTLHKPKTSYTYDVRHILLQFEKTEEGAETEKDTTEIKLLNPADYSVTVDIDINPDTTADPSLYMESQKILETYLKGACDEESFAELARQHSADGNASAGGIYEDVTEGYMVPPFENWALEENRKPGDVGIVETSFGYHIMYFIGKEEVSSWKIIVREAMVYDGVVAFTKKLTDSYTVSVEESDEAELRKLYQESINYYSSFIGG